jgi:Ni,Fe-hydrogenase maturation factor
MNNLIKKSEKSIESVKLPKLEYSFSIDLSSKIKDAVDEFAKGVIKTLKSWFLGK